jgi:membrane protein implicated in regulation of membrane protease activity
MKAVSAATGSYFGVVKNGHMIDFWGALIVTMLVPATMQWASFVLVGLALINLYQWWKVCSLEREMNRILTEQVEGLIDEESDDESQ